MMEINIPENCNPFTREKFEAITSYDQYEAQRDERKANRKKRKSAKKSTAAKSKAA